MEEWNLSEHLSSTAVTERSQNGVTEPRTGTAESR